jgi:hypothetical protein
MLVYVFYAVYVIYTVAYVCNRRRGKPAQFFTARVLSNNPPSFKLFVDICVGGLFVYSLGAFVGRFLGFW